MRRATVVMATCMVVFGLTATSGSASLVNRTVNVCQADATWNVNVPAATATVWWETGFETGCKALNGTIYEDGDIQTGTFDNGKSSSWTFNLVGATVTGQNSFAGTARHPNGAPFGTLEVVGGIALSGQVTWAYTDPEWQGVVAYYPNGTCGSNCYRTKMVMEEAWSAP